MINSERKNEQVDDECRSINFSKRQIPSHLNPYQKPFIRLNKDSKIPTSRKYVSKAVMWEIDCPLMLGG